VVLGRAGSIEDIAAQAVTFCQAESITGQVLSTWTEVLPQFTLLEKQAYISFQTVGGSLRPQRPEVAMTHKPQTVAKKT
jgi:hypothetical protein